MSSADNFCKHLGTNQAFPDLDPNFLKADSVPTKFLKKVYFEKSQ